MPNQKNPFQKKLRWSKKGEGGVSVFLLKVKKHFFVPSLIYICIKSLPQIFDFLRLDSAKMQYIEMVGAVIGQSQNNVTTNSSRFWVDQKGKEEKLRPEHERFLPLILPGGFEV